MSLSTTKNHSARTLPFLDKIPIKLFEIKTNDKSVSDVQSRAK